MQRSQAVLECDHPLALEGEFDRALLLASGLKYELDALANNDFRYLTKTYLPRKLREKDWLG